MCFSASASFVAGASLLAIGATTVKKVERKAELPFAKDVTNDVKALTQPEVRQQLMNQGIEPRDMTPAAFSEFVRREVEKCAKIIKASGARAELQVFII